jgi:hypothetical protein
MESVNQALGKTPTTIRLDHLTPTFGSHCTNGGFHSSVDLHGGKAAQKWECKSFRWTSQWSTAVGSGELTTSSRRAVAE